MQPKDNFPSTSTYSASDQPKFLKRRAQEHNPLSSFKMPTPQHEQKHPIQYKISKKKKKKKKVPVDNKNTQEETSNAKQKNPSGREAISGLMRSDETH